MWGLVEMGEGGQWVRGVTSGDRGGKLVGMQVKSGNVLFSGANDAIYASKT